jgi:hypothetical protein
MPQTQPRMEVPTLASSPASIPSCAPKHKRLAGRLRRQHLRYRLRVRFRATMYIWKSAFGSLLGHIRSQSTKEPPLLNFGPALVRDSAGELRQCTRTHARAEYIKAVLATRPWADTIDLRMFLDGFDAGEQWTLYTTDKGSDRRPESGSWLASVEYVPSKIIQPSNEVNGQISFAIPAAIAGVTRSDECTRQKL